MKAEPLEAAVMRDLIENFGDEKKRAELLLNGSGDAAIKAQKDLDRYEAELKKIARAKEKLLDAVEEETLPPPVIKERMQSKLAREEKVKSKIEGLQTDLATLPTKDEMSAMERALRDAIDFVYYGTEAHLQEMTFDQKRDLVRLIFGSAEKGTGVNKKRGQLQPKFVKAGVYVQKNGKDWRYRIKGSFPVILGRLHQLKKADPSL